MFGKRKAFLFSLNRRVRRQSYSTGNVKPASAIFITVIPSSTVPLAQRGGMCCGDISTVENSQL